MSIQKLKTELDSIKSKVELLQIEFDKRPCKETAKRLSDCKNIELKNAETKYKLEVIKFKNSTPISTRSLC